MKNKIFFLPLFVVAFIIGGVCTNVFISNNTNDSLLLENIEALTVTETHTTWNCDATNNKTCCLRCDACRTHVHGKGKMSGTHSCS